MDSKKQDQNIFEKVKALYMDRAIHIASCDQKVRKLVDKVSRKWKEVSQNPAFAEVKYQLEVFIRMMRSHLNKKYSGLSNRTLGLLVLGLFYFALPLDFVPDFIPFIGYVDDITVLLAIFKSIQSDIALFLEWEKNQL
ncbi:MAG: YkvA family protein [Cyclobacteriaceae bacterium]